MTKKKQEKVTKSIKFSIKNPQHLEFELLKERIIYFHGEFSGFRVNEVMMKIDYLNSVNHKPITINITSPGGSVDSGIALYDQIKDSPSPIYVHCGGMAASMAAIILAAGKKGFRTAGKNARIMIHQPSSGYIGKASDIENHAQELARVRKLLSQLISNDTGKPLKQVVKDMNEDYWMSAEQALEYGLIDKII